MKLKVKHQLKRQPENRRPRLNEINELTMSIFIIKRSQEQKLKERIISLGGEVLSMLRGIGVSRYSVFESLKVGTDDCTVFFVISRVEDVRDLMQTISEEFKLATPGSGKGFCIDIDGYLGAKAAFID